MSAKWERPAKTERDFRPYRESLSRPTVEDIAFFDKRYEVVADETIYRGVDGRYLLEMFDHNGMSRGWVSRAPWPDSPLSKEPHKAFPKADTYMHGKGPVQSWHRRPPWDTPTAPVLVLVEDQLSAIKLEQMGIDAVAVLGVPNSEKTDNYSGQDRVAEIAQHSRGYEEIVVAFDADATDQSFKFVRKWGSAFHSPVRVAILTRDIKDTPRPEILRVLGVDK